MNPLVSVIMPTYNRPHLLPIALECYRQQTYENRELIVIDDGDVSVDEARIAAVGGRLIRVAQGYSLGHKLNIGIAHARGVLIQRMDDDDYYAPNFMERLVYPLLWTHEVACEPMVAGMHQRLFLDVLHWELRRHTSPFIAGNSLLCYRADWEDSPFRPIMNNEDTWFERDIIRHGGLSFQVEAEESVIVIRHTGHTWNTLRNGTAVDDDMRRWPSHPATPETVLPEWALRVYASIRADLLHRGSS